jgi:RND family efflux transporter MFP subunit
MRKVLFLMPLNLVIALCVLSASGCKQSGEAGKAKEAPRVGVAHPTVRELTDEDDYNGWLEAYKTQKVTSRVRGHIKKVLFQDGDMVKVGQPLFELDPAPFEADVRKAEAMARAYDAQKVAAEKDVSRYGALLQTGGASKQQFEKAQADAESYDAQIAAEKAEVDRLRLDLSYSKIAAEISGRISKAELTEGNLVNAGGNDQVLTTIVTVDPIYVTFNIDERAMQRYQAVQGKDSQQPLRDQNISFYFGLETEKGYPREGKIVFADNKYTEGTGTIPIRGLAKNTDGRLVPGSRVRVRIPVSEKYSGTLLPDTAVSTDQTQKYLLLVGDDKIVKRQNVVLGRLLDDGMRVILEPKLDPSVWVIVEGMERARLNYPVDPISESAPAGVKTAK